MYQGQSNPAKWTANSSADMASRTTEKKCEQFPSPAKLKRSLPPARKARPTFRSRRLWSLIQLEEYSALMDASGMAQRRVWGENADRYFPGREAMIQWIDQPSLVPFLAHIPDGAKPRFREYVIGRMIDETRQDDGRCFETFRRINVSARK